LKLYPEEAGKVWVKLSDYFIRLGEFERAREVLEEAIESVDNAKDFGIIFSAYVKFSEEMITALANEEIKSHFQVVEEDNVDYEIQTRIERLEKLLKRQPFLLLNISIKNNPHNVQNWLNLINLYVKEGDLELAEGVIERAIATVVPEHAEGKLSEIWVKYTEILQNEGQLRRCN
jgi:pre-mRNA-splicing factor SYF1